MVSNQHKQNGMTFISLVIMFVFIGMLLLAALRVIPLYMENMAVDRSIKSFVEVFNSNPSMPINSMKNDIQRKFDVNEVRSIIANDIIIKRTRNGYSLDASYHPVVNYVGNLNFMLDFEHFIQLEK